MLDESNLSLLESYIESSHTTRSKERFSRVHKQFNEVLKDGRLSDVGFTESDVEAFLLQLGRLDSNNWDNRVGVGEREGRVLMNLVHRRHFGLTHGIGRSGDIAAIQPKAPGSSLINRLTNRLLLDWLRKSGAPSTANCFLVPMATGMTLTLCMLTLKQRRQKEARFVVWPRIDQKSCFKCILAAGMIPVPVDLQEGSTSPKHVDDGKDQLQCDLRKLRKAIRRPVTYLLEYWPDAASKQGITQADARRQGPNSVVCVLSTTLCFAPRVPDRLHAITKLCSRYGVSYLVNNAYGCQSVRCMRMIESVGQFVQSSPPSNEKASGSDSASDSAQPDQESKPDDCNGTKESKPIDVLYVQSTDKNLLVPVGGAIVAGFSDELVTAVAKSYPGRASASPSIDVLATLLHLGRKGWSDLLERRKACFLHLQEGLRQVGNRYGLRLLQTVDNPISLALELNPLCCSTTDTARQPDATELSKLTKLGARLFTKGCSGVRVVLPASVPHTAQTLGAYTFAGFGSHNSNSTVAYLNAAAALGQTTNEVDAFLMKLDTALTQFQSQTGNMAAVET